MKNTVPLTIGKLASSADVNVETIRYYQRMGLIIEPPKPVSGFRHYPESDIERVRFTKRAQQLGFTLKEIQDLLALGEKHCKEVQALAKEKLDKIESHMKDLKSMRSALKSLLLQCEADTDSNAHCAIIESLSRRGFKSI